MPDPVFSLVFLHCFLALFFSMKWRSATLTSHVDQPLASTTFALPPAILINFDPQAQKPAYDAQITCSLATT